MARSRNIKPGFFGNDELAECDPLARILFAGLWTIADREGRLEYRPKKIKRDILPYDNCDIPALIDQLDRHNFIILYQVDDVVYIEIPTFLDHQNPHKNEPDSTLPASDNSGARIVHVSDINSSNPADSLNLIPDSLNIDSSTRRERRQSRVKAEQGKVQFAEFVSMTNEEHSSLVAEVGEHGARRCIEILDNYKGANGKKYKSDYRAIRNWVVGRYREEEERARSGTMNKSRMAGVIAGTKAFLEEAT